MLSRATRRSPDLDTIVASHDHPLMPRPGRNQSCPCGSGRKYKQCCGGAQTRPVAYTSEDRESALAKLTALLNSVELDAEHDAADEDWWGDLGGPPDDLDPALDPMIEDAYEGWFAFDRSLADGRRPAEQLLAEDPSITRGERAWLEAGLASSMELYEVVGVVPGASLTLRHALSRLQVQVAERTGSRTLRKWDVLAARVFQAGPNRAEFDRGLYALPRHDLSRISDQLALRMEERAASGDPLPLEASLPPAFHQLWIGPLFGRGLPTITAPDGEELLFTTVRFTVDDPDQVREALVASPQLEPNPDTGGWIARGESAAPRTLPWFVDLQGDRLVLQAMTRKQALFGRQLLEGICGRALRHESTVHEDPARKAIEGPPPPREPPTEEEERAVLAWQDDYSRKWLAMDIPALQGKTPRQAAAGSAADRDRLATLLGDLEHGYERALLIGQAAYDPTWMWAELGLEDHPDAPARDLHPPLLGHELASQQIEGLLETAQAIADRRRGEPGFGPSTVVTHEELERDLGLLRLAMAAGEALLQKGSSRRDGATEATVVGAHVEYLANFLLHHRKVFWVDASVAWLLAHTKADFAAEHLALPFASFALVYTDRHTLSLAERLAAADPDCGCRGCFMRSVTAYVTRIPGEESDAGLRIALLCVASPDRWPWMVVRDLPLRPGQTLDQVLAGRFEELAGGGRDPLFESRQLRTLLEVVLNSILYATSAGAESVLRQPPTRSRRPAKETLPLSSEQVWFLPGTIDISRLRALQAKQREEGGGQLTHRSMVRGHWRSAAKGWKDERPRWIEPYWKGPDMAAMTKAKASRARVIQSG